MCFMIVWFKGHSTMEDHIYEDHDDTSSVNTDIPSDPWLDAEDVNFCTPFLKSNQTGKCDNENIGLDESNLKKKEIDLYNDLIMIEEEEKKSKLQLHSEVENLKKELEMLKKTDADKSKKISELTKENTNLKKSICSLYQTVKSEIEHKDHLLAEANRKIDNILFSKKSQNLRTDKNEKTTDDFTHRSNQGSHKRKRSPEADSERRCKSSLTNSKNSNLICDRSTKYASDRNHHKSNNDSQTFENNDDQNVILQTPETFRFTGRNSTETDNLFFDLVPSSLKKAFYEYEQNQFISLNNLKQSLINEYFRADKSTLPNPEDTPKRPRGENNFSKYPKDSDFVKKSYSTQNDKTVASKRNSAESNCKVTSSMQNNLVSLYRYRKERIPFLEKRKFDLLKEGKALIPKDLL